VTESEKFISFFIIFFHFYRLQFSNNLLELFLIWHRFLEYLAVILSLLLTLAWTYSVCIIIKNIVYEKEQRLKEVTYFCFHILKLQNLGELICFQPKLNITCFTWKVYTLYSVKSRAQLQLGYRK